MFKVIPLSALACALLSAAMPAMATPSVHEILIASDEIRNPDQPFAIDIDLTEYRNKKREQEGRVIAYAKMNASRGQHDTLVRIVEPVRDRSKMMLKNGNEIWFYDPASQSGMRISPQQRLLGQASNGDVVTVNLAHDYTGQIEAEETITDGERKERPCYRIKLSANNPEVTYNSIEYWVERGSNRPVKSNFYAESGRLFKTAYYRRFENQLGKERPTETIIIDGVDPQLVTVMRYSKFRYKDIPDAWLRRDGLATVRE
ncbi:outer membrane lipoprotein-sorting protein [Oxalobacteraceae bacterium GrIS 1.11]